MPPIMILRLLRVSNNNFPFPYANGLLWKLFECNLEQKKQHPKSSSISPNLFFPVSFSQGPIGLNAEFLTGAAATPPFSPHSVDDL
jgi:hypothetical protein